ELRDDGRIRERRRVADRLALGNVAQQPAHDLARSGFRQVRREQNVVGPRNRANLLHHVLFQSVDEVLWQRAGSDALLERDERGNRLTLDLVRAANDSRLRDAWVIDERALHFHRANAMTGDVDDVVHATEQPVVAVRVAFGAVAGHVNAAAPLVPVLPDVAVRIAVDAAEHRRPRARQRQQSSANVDLVAAFGANFGADAGERFGRRSGLERGHARQWRDHDRAGLRLPPRVDDGAARTADELVVPDPGLGIDRFTDRSEEAERR